MSRADEVWLVSNWPEEDVGFMNGSLANLSKLNPEITIFGKKYFGAISAATYRNLNETDWERDHRRQEEIARDQLINDQIERAAASAEVRFIDTQRLVCEDDEICSNYRSGNIISYDGSHLTPFGARLLGKRLEILLVNDNP